MSNDITVEITPEVNNQICLTVRGKGLPQAGQKLQRPSFNLAVKDIDQLRRGDAPPILVQQVTAEVSTWLLATDLNLLLVTALVNAGSEQVRLVFSMDEGLRTTLADMPVELVELEGTAFPLVLSPKVSAIVHLLPKVGMPPISPPAQTWPLRVLIVRSNPADLGGGVPKAATIRDEIMKLGQQLGPNLVEVDLLSSEDGVKKPATWEAFIEQLRTPTYDIIVYVGHGDLLPTFGELVPGGVLQLETADAKNHTPVSIKQLKGVLYKHPVPVVILAGCLTAAEVSNEFKGILETEIPKWMRGNQGVAQALVNSGESGVQFAVGMRYRLETQDAVAFLRTFFRSLLHDKPGDCEEAVRAGREVLHAFHPHPPSWSAPVVFSALGDEPRFKFLAAPRPVSIEAFDERDKQIRTIMWNGIAQQPLSKRLPGSLDPMYQVLKQMEQGSAANSQSKGPLIMPGMIEAEAGQTITLPIELFGELTPEVLKGRLTVSGEAVSIQSVRRTQAVKERGYDVLSMLEGNEVIFRIEPASTNGGSPLPQGPLFEITLTLGTAFSVVYNINVNIHAIQPRRTIRSGNNAIIVPPS